uniref:Uncharacterized protein n=1 Tax=Glossina morsitans morsitans TaxID=37546 RepID=A0A1B0FPP6_GLOMM
MVEISCTNIPPELSNKRSVRILNEYYKEGVAKLREVVSKLSAHDKIVHLHFDEVFTDQTRVYSRSEHRLYGCGYVLGRKLVTTKEHRTVLVFGVRSLLTAFSMLLSAYPMAHTSVYGRLIEENIKYAVAIGL